VTIRSLAAAYLGVTESEILAAAQKAPRTYRRYLVPKRSGAGMREIFHPSKETKALQYALLQTVLPGLPVHDAAVGYIRGLRSPLLCNAQAHSGFRFTVRLDFQDFFPSITPDDLLRRLRAIEEWDPTDKKDRDFLTDALFIDFRHSRFLAIGAPSSPAISNAVMIDLDRYLEGWAIEHNGRYTRYADDILYSTNEKGGCHKFAECVAAKIATMESPDLMLNEDKTLYMSRGTRRSVTGLIVTPEGDVSVGRSRKRYLRGLIYRYGKYLAGEGEFDEGLSDSLRGLLAFVLDVEPAFFNRLAQRYGAKVVNSALHGRRLD
jgi:RNA-directed DNA polymerase